MKPKSLASSLFIFLLISLPGMSYAEDDPIVEPNQYEERDIELQTEYFHEDSLLKKKQSLPEEQKALTFEPVQDTELESVERNLFQTSPSENNTIQAKVEQLQLFTSKDEDRISSNDSDTVDSSSFNLTLLLGIIVALAVIGLFFFLVPRLGQSNFQSSMQPKRKVN